MEQNVKKTFWLKLIAAFVCNAAVYAAGALASAGASEAAREAAAIPALIALVSMAVLLVANLAATQIYKKSKDAMSVEQKQNYLDERKSSARENLSKSVRRVKRIRIGIEIYTVLLAVLAVTYVFACGFSGESGSTLIGLYIFYGLIRRIHRVNKSDFTGYSEEKDFPTIYAIAKKAAENVGVEGEIKIMFTWDCNAGIAKIGNVNSLQLGAVLLDLLSKEELYSVLVHEFAHLTKKCYPAKKEFALFSYITNTDNSHFSQYTNLFFKFPEIFFAYEFFIYRCVASSTIEAIADSAVLEHGNPQDAISGLAKIDYEYFFGKELYKFIPEPYYKPEACREDARRAYAAALRRAIGERKDAWDGFLKNEIEARSASHPTLKNRMAALGVAEYTVALPEGESPYRRECAAALEKVDREIYDAEKETYAEEREEKYLAPMRTVEEWKRSGKNPPAEEVRPLIDALASLCLYGEMETLCDALIAETENKFALPYVYMAKGHLLLMRYDKSGIDYMYKALEDNHNYIEWALDEIGEFCCRMGLAEELEEYRRKAVEYDQAQEDKYDGAGELSAGDNVVQSDMPAELLGEIVSFIQGADEKEQVRAVYLVKKIITDDFSSDIFLLVFRNDYDGEACSALYRKVFDFLDTHPSDKQFSLFVYDKSYNAVLKKVKDYIVFER